MIDFEDPGLEFVIKEDIKAEDLEAYRVFIVVWLAAAVGVSEHRLH